MSIDTVLVSCKAKLSGLGKYKYALLILMVGIILMVYPFGEKQEPVQAETIVKEFTMEDRLEDILSQVDSVGTVQVLLSLKEGYSYTYQTDERSLLKDQEQENELETVLLRDETGAESPVIKHTRYPVYEGAVVVCEGADSPSVRLHVVNAVSDLTGLGSDKISVIKMKGN